MNAVMNEGGGNGVDFIDYCSCRVWAIDGWENKDICSAFNIKISEFGFDLARDVKNLRKLSLDDKVALLVGQNWIGQPDRRRKPQDQVAPRISAIPRSVIAANNKDCVIYGYFQYKGDTVPTHMWLEYQGFIYDTVPGSGLVRKRVVNGNVLSPGCVTGEYLAENVGRAAAVLTKRQSRVLKAADGSWLQQQGSSLEVYCPADQVT